MCQIGKGQRFDNHSLDDMMQEHIAGTKKVVQSHWKAI